MSPPPVCRASIVLLSVTVPLKLYRPPPKTAVLLATVQLVRLSVPWLNRPPPTPPEALLPRKVQLIRVAVPALFRPAPAWEVLLLKVQLVRVAVPLLYSPAPPPLPMVPVALLPVKVQPASTTVPR